jgi:pimeloyl-ACP methyl ester carboxylesterase
VSRHLTLHGTNWNADGSMTWKFDNYIRALAPYGHDIRETTEIFSRIACPALLFRGLESFAPLPEGDSRFEVIPNCRLITVPNAGHWLHHDQRELFVRATAAFLKS